MASCHLARTGAAVALTLLALTACGTDVSDPTASAPTPTVPAASSSAAPPASTAVASSSAPEADSTFDITLAGGEVTGDTGRLKVAVGEQVAIRVNSDKPDEVHLHGYDVTAVVSPGQPAELLFEATIPGVFEIELEDSGTALASLQVS